MIWDLCARSLIVLVALVFGFGGDLARADSTAVKANPDAKTDSGRTATKKDAPAPYRVVLSGPKGTRPWTFPFREVAGLVRSAVQGRGAGKLVNVRLWLRPSTTRAKIEACATKGSVDTSIRRDLSIYLLARDKATVLKTINMFGCYPISCNAGDHDTGSAIKSIVFTCNVDRIEEAK